jgi:hypothetical protein
MRAASLVKGRQPSGVLPTQYFFNQAAIYSSDFGNRIAIKVQIFALT